MRKTRTPRPWMTVVVVAIWVLAMVVPALLTPTPSEASVKAAGWMTYAPNHPNGCAPLPYDCYVIWVYPDD